MNLLPSGLPLFGAMMPWLNPLWMVAVGAMVALAVLFGLYFALKAVAPKLAAIAQTTTKEATSQPVFYVVLVVAAFGLVLFPFVPYNTFGEDIKVLQKTGLTWIMVTSLMVALWTASVSIADEIEGRTALTLLSKPVSRRSFITGKFLGIIGAVAILFIILGALFLCTVSFKVVYDAGESSLPEPTASQCSAEMAHIAPGLALAFLEAIVLTSISVAISTRLPMMANLMICVSVYVLGHLVPLVVVSTVGRFEIVPFVGQLLATILPVLDHFNIYAAISEGKEVPWSYVGWASVYSALFSTVAMLVALLLFEDRDLA